MIKFHDYNPSEPFPVNNEWHYIDKGEVTLNYTPRQGSMKVLIDGVEATEAQSKVMEAGQFYVNYSADSDYRMATQKVYFNEADSGKKATFDYEGVSTLIMAKHFNEIRDFMNGYNEDRARDLFEGKIPLRSGEKVEKFSKPKLTDSLSIPVVSVAENVITVDSVDGLEAGETYTLSDGEQFEEFTVDSIDTDNKTVTAKELVNTYETGTIYKTTASIVDGKATVLNGTQTIKWDVDEIWQGRSGEGVESEKAVTALPEDMSGISLNQSGEFEVEDFDRKSFYVVSPISAQGSEYAVHITTSREPVTWIGKIMLYSGGYSSITAFMTRSYDILPLTARDIFGNIKSHSYTAEGVKGTAYYIPPIWICSFPHPDPSFPFNYLGVSLSEQPNTKLHPAFNDYKNGFYIFPNSAKIEGAKPLDIYGLSIASLYTSFFCGLKFKGSINTNANAKSCDYVMDMDTGCWKETTLNSQYGTFSSASVSSFCTICASSFGAADGYGLILSKEEAEEFFAKEA